MGDYTYEGATRHPIWPSSASIAFTAGNASGSAAADYADASATNYAIAPVASHLDDALNSDIYPQKITADNTNKHIWLAAGVYRVDLNLLLEETGGSAAVEPGVVICDDDTQAHVSSTTNFFEYDGAGNADIAASKSLQLNVTTLVKIDTDSNIRLVVVDRAAGAGTLTIRDGRMLITRLSKYSVT